MKGKKVRVDYIDKQIDFNQIENGRFFYEAFVKTMVSIPLKR